MKKYIQNIFFAISLVVLAITLHAGIDAVSKFYYWSEFEEALTTIAIYAMLGYVALFNPKAKD